MPWCGLPRTWRCPLPRALDRAEPPSVPSYRVRGRRRLELVDEQRYRDVVLDAALGDRMKGTDRAPTQAMRWRRKTAIGAGQRRMTSSTSRFKSLSMSFTAEESTMIGREYLSPIR
jgi:hypothetical protein